MLPRGVRLLVRRQARSVSHQLQPRLKSTDTGRHGFADFLSWAFENQRPNRPKRSQPRSGIENAQVSRPLKKQVARKGKGPDSLRPKHVKNLPDARTREVRILKAVAAVAGNKKPPRRTATGWPGENWKSENWGSDKLRPKSRPDPIVELKKPKGLKSGFGEFESQPSQRIRKSEVTYPRKLEGVLRPLGSPVLQDVVPLTKHRPVANLAHKLDRVLFNPGVHWLQEPRTGVYNFAPWLQSIPDVNDFAFERLPAFVKSSRDEDLWELAKREGRLFCGSTSSLTGMLSQVYFLISGCRPPDTSSLSQPFRYLPADFTPGQRMPVSVLLNYRDGAYAIDSAYKDGDDPEKNVLTWLGTLLEKFLTMPPEEFQRLLRDSPNPAADCDGDREAYRYAKSGKFVMRSQLDCRDPRLPGTGVFDLKTRAALPVRMDLMNYKQHSTYLIRTLQGEFESFEREYHDLMRSAFLKYGFQARIGNMDGILVVHHNTARMFGFRYIPLSEMDTCLFGGPDRGEAVFEKCVLLLEEILMEVISTFPAQTVRCLFETRGDKLNIFVEPEAHDESKGPRPLVHLEVKSTSFIDGSRTDSGSAVAKSGSWDLHWSICHTSLSHEEKERRLENSKERQRRGYCLPPGVSIEEMEDIWNQLDFGGKQRRLEETSEASSGNNGSLEERETTFDPSSFAVPSKNVRFLRELSMQGKADMELMSEKAKGRPKLIWGEPEACIDRVEWDGAPSETVEVGEMAGESVVVSEGAIPVDGDVRTDEVTDYTQAEEKRPI